ncbi:MAG TPA: SDR family oxidoreductase, partial [Herpetosiphonaceae bacterium]
AAALRGQLAAWDRERFDILVNNAGILRLGTFDAVTEADLDAIYAVNYKSPFFLTQRLLGDLADGGRIINIGSGTARIAFGPLVAYGPLKAALQSLTLYLANFLGPRGIAVNAVAPGGLDNEFNADVFRRLPQARDYIIGGTALGRIGGSADVGGAIAFLAGPAGGFVSGAVLPVDGGYHL